MDRRSQLNPGALPPGTLVGPWQVTGWRGRGNYGTVYQALKRGHEGSGLVALKLAHFPEDKRFGREAELLSRIHHPHVPRLLDAGHWPHPSGAFYPYLAMEWVEGEPLYTWGQVHQPSSRQVLRVLAQLARALEATQAAGGVHRDVKGDNIVVMPAEAQAYLMDFGSGIWTGAPRITEEVLPPGTRPYRSPEAWRFQGKHRLHRTVRYEAAPGEDVYALGVTAYRLVTGVYPPPAWEPSAREDGQRSSTPIRSPPQVLNARVALPLAVLIERMLAEAPDVRGSAGAMAEALEEAAQRAGPEADVPLFGSKRTQEAPRPLQEHSPVSARKPARRGMLWKAAPVLGVLLVGSWWRASRPHSTTGTQFEEQEGPEAKVGLLHAAVTEPVGATKVPPGGEGVALDLPQRPLPGQLKPDASGRCPGRSHTSLNGGCWRALKGGEEKCAEDEYVHKGECYAPVFSRGRQPTSESSLDAGSP
ncbi:serine/threonine-protein kinase [Stigmatella aurantiaca]|uniref:Protein kinase n=1 Tax=Stigmatella aurantiaca (strain DW4/3-1) TaxID=378806 RepID=Q099N7_STIAD|nr:serine/threonine-protein kinase [Stigmatella aurantiaca]ADO75848.1 Protein kinase [Stigmatella aurantiaca DW4/3-1]EAU68424.1 protein kinase [Stigmatella aurantiaca DW4/3-1]